MTGHLARLALRTTRPVPGLRPRTPAHFEQGTQAWSLEPDAMQPDAVPPAARQRADRLSGPGPDVPWPDVGPPDSAGPARNPRAERSLNEVGPWGPSTSSLRSPSSGRASPGEAFGGDVPTPTEPQARRTHPVEPLVRSPRSRPDGPDGVTQERPDNTLDRAEGGASSASARTELPVRTTARPASTPALSADGDSARVRPDPADLSGDGATGELRVRGALPEWNGRLNSRPEGSTPGSESPDPGLLSPSAPLPRLQPQTDREPNRAPEVTVTIGRIEVLPAPQAAPPPPPVRKPARRTTNAPDLASYLRDRGLQ